MFIFYLDSFDLDIYKNLLNKTQANPIYTSTYDYYKHFSTMSMDFEYLFDNYKAEKITIENGNFQFYNFKLDNDLDHFKGIFIKFFNFLLYFTIRSQRRRNKID